MKISDFMINLYQDLSNDKLLIIYSIEIKKNFSEPYILHFTYADNDRSIYTCNIFDDLTASIYLGWRVEDGIEIQKFIDYKEVISRIKLTKIIIEVIKNN